MKRAASFLLLALLFVSVPARARVTYDVPIDWIRIETQGDYEEAYETSHDPAKRVFVLVRRITLKGSAAEEWAETQSRLMKQAGNVLTGPPGEERFGDTVWWYVDWKDRDGVENGRRYFLASSDRIVEVSLLARSEVFATADASQFDAFFASFKG